MSDHQEVARAEGERGEVVLRRRLPHHPGAEHAAPVLELRVNGTYVMDTHETSTEVALAEAALALVDEPRHVVVGGLGLGFTLQAVLADPRVERVRVVEVEEALVGWFRDGTVPHGPGLLADRRAELVCADVVQAGREARDRYDLVLLDVDNGPDQLVHEGNAEVYAPGFLGDVRRLLRPGGCVVVWSAHPAPRLLSTLQDVYGSATEHELPVTLQHRDTHYYLYLARSTP